MWSLLWSCAAHIISVFCNTAKPSCKRFGLSDFLSPFCKLAQFVSKNLLIFLHFTRKNFLNPWAWIPKLILAAARGTLDGSLSFPEVVGQLLAAGVEYYHVDYVGLRKRFYSAAGRDDGHVHQL